MLLFAPPLAAQITVDGTLGGEAGSAIQSGNGYTYDITEQYGHISGANLFHSFELFSVGKNESANFSSAVGGIDNILARVTGGKASLLEGRMSSTIDGADFWFINPAGLIVGDGASLDFSGSIHLATASSIESSSGDKFSAVNPTDVGSLEFTPAAFGFVGAQAATLQLEGTELSLAPRQKLLLAGTNVSVNDSEIEGEQALVALVGVGSGNNSLSVSEVFNGSGGGSGAVDLVESDLDVSGPSGGQLLISGGALTVNGTDLASDADDDFVPGMSQGRIALRGNTISVMGGTDIESRARAANHTADISLIADSSITISDTFTSVVSLPFRAGSTGGDITYKHLVLQLKTRQRWLVTRAAMPAVAT